jgi:hypothetical protein
MAESPRRPRRIARTPVGDGFSEAHARQVRSPEYMARQTGYMINEMKRVLGVSILCFGMLAVLVVVDRLQ